MKDTTTIAHAYRALKAILFAVILALSACAAPSTYYDDSAAGEMVFHSFSFDARKDSPDIEIIDYRYGTAKVSALQNKHEERAQGKSWQSDSSSGRGLRGTELYVKWRIKSTGEVLEDRVDLKSRQPASIEGQTVYFVVDAKRLYVYQISKDPVRPYMTHDEVDEKDDLIRGTRLQAIKYYSRFNVVQIYPERVQVFPFYSKKSR